MSSPAGARPAAHAQVTMEQQRRLLSHPLLARPVVTAEQLRIDVAEQQERLARSDARLDSLRSQLQRAAQESQAAIHEASQGLHALPDELGELEDEMDQLSSHLGARPGSQQETSPAESPTSATPVAEVLAELQRRQALLRHTRQARRCVALLARAEHLHDAALAAERAHPGDKRALLPMLKLHSLVLAANDALGAAESSSPLHSLAFLAAKRDATYASLRESRSEKLRIALARAGWPPLPPEIASRTKQESASPARILADADVRASWKALCQLQCVGSRPGWVRRPGALVPIALGSQPKTSSRERVLAPPDPAGSASYVSLHACHVLLEPIMLRFRYHFDSDRSTNRLDRPEWYLNHALMLLRNNASLFAPSRGAVAHLCRSAGLARAADVVTRGRGHAVALDTTRELLHEVLRLVRNKVQSSVAPLLEPTRSELLAHTILECLRFDEELVGLFPSAGATFEAESDANDLGSGAEPEEDDAEAMTESGVGIGTRRHRRTRAAIRVASVLLDDVRVFEAWVEGERAFCQERFDEMLDDAEAWTIVGAGGQEGEEGVEGVGVGQAGSWIVGTADGDGDAGGNPRSTTEMATTISARRLASLVDSLTTRYRLVRGGGGRSTVSRRLPFLLLQLSLLRGYAARLSRSLEAFESLSTAFARPLPGGIEAAAGSIPSAAGLGPDSEMVRGLRGAARLLKAYLSASFLARHVEGALERDAFFGEVAAQVGDSHEARASLEAMRRQREEEQADRELDRASLAELLRRGYKAGAGAARSLRPLASSSSAAASSTASTPRLGASATLAGGGSAAPRDAAVSSAGAALRPAYDIWAEPRVLLSQVRERAARDIERLVCSEVAEVLRPYTLRTWASESIDPPGGGQSNDEDEEDDPWADPDGTQPTQSRSAAASAETRAARDGDEGAADEAEEYPTPSLFAALSALSSHLGHLVPLVPPDECAPIYRRIAAGVANNVVDRVVMSGGTHRFDEAGGRRLWHDYTEGWLALVQDVLATAAAAPSSTSTRADVGAVVPPLGRRPEAPWRPLRDAALLLALPSERSNARRHDAVPRGARFGAGGGSVGGGWSDKAPPTQGWTLEAAVRAAFDGEGAGAAARLGREWGEEEPRGGEEPVDEGIEAEDSSEDDDGGRDGAGGARRSRAMAKLRRELNVAEATEDRWVRLVLRRRVECSR